MKQDRAGVRTAQDLERKYNLADLVGIKKAVQLQEEGINKTNAELENFMKSTIGDIENLQSQIDGQIHTFYYSGVPSMSTPPVTEWAEEEYNLHLGDLYYDKDTGYAYRFFFDSETNKYDWVQVTDDAVTEALAIANAALDTADSKRRVFLTSPTPPYDNGDLWLNNQELYVCQISKGKDESFESNDFIIATKYTDDTVATQIGNELTVVKGQVTTINEKANGLDITITENTSLINSLTEEVVNEIDERKAIIRLQQEGGIPIVELGSSESPVKTKYKNDGMYIETNGAVTTYYKNGKAYNTEMEAEIFVMGNFTWKTRNNGNYSLLFTGSDE
jgi:phage-related protein